MTTASAPAEGLFDTITGLPVHPLVVHFAVVLLPLAALGLILIVLVPRWRRPFGWLTMIGLAVGTGAAFVAKESGEALAERVGEPERHASLGDVLPLVAAALFVVALVWFLLDRRRAAAGAGSSIGVTILGIASIVIALGAIGLTVAVGHSGAEATWAGEISSTSDESGSGDGGEQGEGSEGSETGESTEGAGAPSTAYTLADVQAHATPESCWTAINGTVYDVTSWIGEHPGGARDIERLCGIDGTSDFVGEHGTERRPNSELQQFAIGSLTGPQASPAAFLRAPAATVYTRAQVRKHNSADDCWTIIGRGVYDLTSWVNRHPGGASRIVAICGRDGTQAFRAQHAGESRPASELASFRIGRLARPASA